MTAPYRALRPAPFPDGQQPADFLRSNERPRAALACQSCREKRRKCSGQRPQCRECGRRQQRCVYDARVGQTRMAHLKEENERMKTDLDTMMELYWYLQNTSKGEAGEALAAIQAGAVASEVMEAVKSRIHSTEAISSSSSAPVGKTPNDVHLDQEQGSTDSSDPPSRETTETQPTTEQSATKSPSRRDLTLSPLPKLVESLGKGAKEFFKCTGCIFHIYDMGEVEASFNDLRPYLEESGKSWQELVFQGLIPLHIKPSLASLCAMAAVGLQYTRDPIPALGFVPSGSDGSYEFVSVFYESARYLLDSVVELNVLEAMKVCAALTMFNTIGHATVALAYANTGMNFVLNLDPSLQFRPNNLSEALWIKHKRVARTLITLRSWLACTLGYIHSDHVESQTSIKWLMTDVGLTPTETIQQQLNKVFQIEANLLRTLDSFKELSPVLLSSTKRDLAQWHHNLPEWMRLSALLNPGDESMAMRRTIYLVHLYYLSASMLLSRLAHGTQTIPNVDGVTSLPEYGAAEFKATAGEGVDAARTAARILQLQMDEQVIFQRCWNYEFSAYMACLLLLRSTAQMRLHDYPQSRWQEDLSHARSCLEVLEYCAQVDKVAALFHERTRGYYDALATRAQPLREIDVLDAPDDFDYLFSIPAKSPAHLAQISQDLLKRINCPFDSPLNFHNEATLRLGFGTHTTLPFNNTPQHDERPWPAIGTALPGMPTGRFLGSSQPHGWDMFLNFNTL